MPQYLLSVWHDDDYADTDFNSPDMQRIVGQVNALNEELTRTGTWVFGAGLRSTASATVVRSTSGDISMTDGPYAETKEQVGRWGVETEYENVFLCGSSAHRGGAVSGIPGHNAAMKVLELIKVDRSRTLSGVMVK